MAFSMKTAKERDLNLIDDKYINNMRKVFKLFALFFALASCSAQLTEKTESSFPNGQAKSVRSYDRNDKCVKETEYYEHGQVKMEGAMKDGEREGEWKAYFPDGRLQSIGTFTNGLRTGRATVWQENGNLLQEGFYREGTHVGKWKFYDEQGNLVKEVDYGE